MPAKKRWAQKKNYTLLHTPSAGEKRVTQRTPEKRSITQHDPLHSAPHLTKKSTLFSA